jgi:hypothetical protein
MFSLVEVLIVELMQPSVSHKFPLWELEGYRLSLPYTSTQGDNDERTRRRQRDCL